jgi:hypothetical protein
MKLSRILAAAVVGISVSACGGGSASGPPPTACALLSRGALSAALGGSSYKRAGTGGTCVYTTPTTTLSVAMGPAEPTRGILEQGPRPGQTVSSGSGYIGMVTTYLQASTYGAQTGMQIVKGSTSVTLLLTNTAKHSGSLVSAVVELGRAAAMRLKS